MDVQGNGENKQILIGNTFHVSLDRPCSCAGDGTGNINHVGPGMKQLLWAEHMSVIIHGAEMEERNR